MGLSHTSFAHPSPTCPFFLTTKAFIARSGEAGLDFLKYEENSAFRTQKQPSLTSYDQVCCDLWAVLGTAPLAPDPTATAVYPCLCCGSWGENIDQIPLTGLGRLIARQDFKPAPSTTGKALALIFKILVTSLSFNEQAENSLACARKKKKSSRSKWMLIHVCSLLCSREPVGKMSLASEGDGRTKSTSYKWWVLCPERHNPISVWLKAKVLPVCQQYKFYFPYGGENMHILI